MSPINADALVDLAYEAVVQPERWQDVLGGLVAFAGGRSGWLSRLDVSTGAGSGLLWEIEPSAQDAYFAYYNRLDPISNVADPPAGLPPIMTDDLRIPKELLTKTEFYNDFMAPQGSHFILILNFGHEGSERWSVNINRDCQSEAFGRDDFARIARVRDGLARAFRLTLRSAAAQNPGPDVWSAWDRSAQPMLLLNASGAIRYANPAAEALLTSSTSLCARGGRLSAAEPASDERLRSGVVAAVCSDASVRRGGMVTLCSVSGRADLVASIIPLSPCQVSLFGADRSVLVALTPAAPPATGAGESFASYYKLTQSEHKLLELMHDGGNLRNAAGELGITYNTARVHLSHIFGKTRTLRQVDLLRLRALSREMYLPGIPGG